MHTHLHECMGLFIFTHVYIYTCLYFYTCMCYIIHYACIKQHRPLCIYIRYIYNILPPTYRFASVINIKHALLASTLKAIASYNDSAIYTEGELQH